LKKLADEVVSLRQKVKDTQPCKMKQEKQSSQVSLSQV